MLNTRLTVTIIVLHAFLLMVASIAHMWESHAHTRQIIGVHELSTNLVFDCHSCVYKKIRLHMIVLGKRGRGGCISFFLVKVVLSQRFLATSKYDVCWKNGNFQNALLSNS